MNIKWIPTGTSCKAIPVSKIREKKGKLNIEIRDKTTFLGELNINGRSSKIRPVQLSCKKIMQSYFLYPLMSVKKTGRNSTIQELKLNGTVP
jgi:hypothetical protein